MISKDISSTCSKKSHAQLRASCREAFRTFALWMYLQCIRVKTAYGGCCFAPKWFRVRAFTVRGCGRNPPLRAVGQGRTRPGHPRCGPWVAPPGGHAAAAPSSAPLRAAAVSWMKSNRRAKNRPRGRHVTAAAGPAAARVSAAGRADRKSVV